MATVEAKGELLPIDGPQRELAQQYTHGGYVDVDRQLELLTNIWESRQLAMPEITGPWLEQHEKLAQEVPSTRLSIAPMLRPVLRGQIHMGISVDPTGLYGRLAAAGSSPVFDETHHSDRQSDETQQIVHRNALRYLDTEGRLVAAKGYGALLLAGGSAIKGDHRLVWSVTNVDVNAVQEPKSVSPAHEVVKRLDPTVIPEQLMLRRCIRIMAGLGEDPEQSIYLSREVIAETHRDGAPTKVLRGVVGLSVSGRVPRSILAYWEGSNSISGYRVLTAQSLGTETPPEQPST